MTASSTPASSIQLPAEDRVHNPYTGCTRAHAEGPAAGTRTPGADDTESWPLILDHTVFGQPMVESASVAIGLRLTRPWLWDRLDARVQDRTKEWLRGALRQWTVTR